MKWPSSKVSKDHLTCPVSGGDLARDDMREDLLWVVPYMWSFLLLEIRLAFLCLCSDGGWKPIYLILGLGRIGWFPAAVTLWSSSMLKLCCFVSSELLSFGVIFLCLLCYNFVV